MSDLTLQEKEEAIKADRILENSIVLSNIVELATSAIIKIAGRDISDTINKESLNRQVLSNLVARQIKEQVFR